LKSLPSLSPREGGEEKKKKKFDDYTIIISPEEEEEGEGKWKKNIDGLSRAAGEGEKRKESHRTSALNLDTEKQEGKKEVGVCSAATGGVEKGGKGHTPHNVCLEGGGGRIHLPLSVPGKRGERQ